MAHTLACSLKANSQHTKNQQKFDTDRHSFQNSSVPIETAGSFEINQWNVNTSSKWTNESDITHNDPSPCFDTEQTPSLHNIHLVSHSMATTSSFTFIKLVWLMVLVGIFWATKTWLLCRRANMHWLTHAITPIIHEFDAHISGEVEQRTFAPTWTWWNRSSL